MAAQTQNTNRHFMSFALFLMLLFAVFRESFKHLSKTTQIVIDDKEDGKQGLRVTYK